MTTSWSRSGCQLYDLGKKTNWLQFWLWPKGVKNWTQPDFRTPPTQPMSTHTQECRLVHVTGFENLPGSRVWISQVRVRVGSGVPVPNPYPRPGLAGFF